MEGIGIPHMEEPDANAYRPHGGDLAANEPFAARRVEPTTVPIGDSALGHELPAAPEQKAETASDGITSFTLDDIEAVLEEVPGVDTATKERIRDALRQQVEARRQEQELEEYNDAVTGFAIAYERSAADNASDSNIEGWYDALGDNAETVLRTLAGQQLDKVQESIRDTAARTYTYLTLERSSFDYLDTDLLAAAGTPPEAMLDVFTKGVEDLFTAARGYEPGVVGRVAQLFPSLRSFEHRTWPELWKRVISPVAAQMRAKMLEAGYQLPELDENGKYGPLDNPELETSADPEVPHERTV